MKILVTGGAGFIGSNIVDVYVKLGHDVVVVDDLSTGKKEFINPKVKFYQADIKDREKIKEIFTNEKPEILNHQAAQISVRKSVENPVFDADINIIGALNLLEEARENGIKKIIFASSGGALYGDATVIPTPESYEPKKPLSPYGIAKYATELYLEYYYINFGIPYVALRYSNVYGPRQNPDGEAGVIAIFCKKLLAGNTPVINGDGKQTRDYVYVEDVANANEKAIVTKYVGGVNIATTKETDVMTLFKELSEQTKKEVSPDFVDAKKGEQKRSCLDINKAKNELNWEPSTGLESGLEKTIKYFSSKL